MLTLATTDGRLAARRTAVRTLALGAVALASIAGRTADAQTYVYHELSTLPGHPSARVYGVNNLGFAVGHVADPITFSRLAVIWDVVAPTTAPASLGIPPHSFGTPDVGAVAINDLGEVIGAGKGVAPPGAPGRGTYHWSAATGFTHLKPVSAGSWHSFQQQPRAINCSGNIVGLDVLFGTFATGFIGLHWNPPTYAPVIQSPPGGIQTYNFVALRIHANNDHDQLVGSFTPSYYTPASFTAQGHAFFWDSSSGYTTLSGGAAGGDANDVNNCEQVIGAVRTSASGPNRATFWARDPGGTFSGTILPGLSNNPIHGSWGIALNDAGQGIGLAKHSSGANRPVVWDLVNASVTDLTAFLPPPDPAVYLTTYDVRDINNAGVIVGTILETLTPLGPTLMTAFVLEPSVAPPLQCASSVCPGAAPAFDLLPPVVTAVSALDHTVEFSITGGTPGESVYIVSDPTGRYRQSIATLCPFGTPPASITVGGPAIVDANGNASFLVAFLNTLSGTAITYVAVEPSTCQLDDETFTHP